MTPKIKKCIKKLCYDNYFYIRYRLCILFTCFMGFSANLLYLVTIHVCKTNHL